MPSLVPTIALYIGYTVMIAAGGIVAALAAAWTWWMAFLLFREMAKHITKIYHVTVVKYWMDRLEEGGMRVFQKAEEYDKSLKAKGVVLQQEKE